MGRWGGGIFKTSKHLSSASIAALPYLMMDLPLLLPLPRLGGGGRDKNKTGEDMWRFMDWRV